MSLVEKGTVRAGGIVFSSPLTLPEGTPVVVQVTVEEAAQTKEAVKKWDIESEPFIGMWADREDMADSVQWEREQRKKWRQRIHRPE